MQLVGCKSARHHPNPHLLAVDAPSLAPAVVPPPGGLHRLWVHAELIEEQQQQPLAAAGVGGVDGGWHRCRGWGGRTLEVLRHEGEQVGTAQARPAAQAVLAAEGLQLVSRLWWRWSMRWAWRLR